MESAAPGDRSIRDGWLNRYLQVGLIADPLRGVAVTSTMPRALAGTGAALSMASIEQFDLLGGAHGPGVAQLMRAFLGATDIEFHEAALAAFEAMETIG